MPPHRTCRTARRGRDVEARDQSTAAGLLAGARRGLDDLQTAQPARRPADRHLSDTAGAPTAMKARSANIARALAGEPMGEAAFGLSAAKKDLATAVQFAASIRAELPVTASALACFEEAEAAGLGDADATAASIRWPQRRRP